MFRLMVASLGLVFGCSVGEVPIGGGGDDDTGVDSGTNPGACATRISPASTAHDHGGGDTRAGQSCIVTGCHLAGGGGGPPYLWAGTIYQPDGTTPAAGVEVRLLPNDGGAALIAKSDTAGNFKFDDNLTNPFGANATTLASGCPAPDSKMAGKLTAPNQGSCNNGTACHANPGGTLLQIANQ